MDDPLTDARLNCMAQLHLLEAGRRSGFSGKIVFTSTRQIYGRPNYLPVDEAHPVQPVDINGVHKQACEQYHELYGRLYGLNYTTLRLTNTYGPRMRIKDASQVFLGIWLRHAREGQPCEVWGGQQLRDFCYVDDAVEALLVAATTSSTDRKTYNIRGFEVASLLDVAEHLVAVSGASYRVGAFDADRLGIDIGDFYADGTRLEADTGWIPRVGLADGLRHSRDYYRTRVDRYI